MVQPRIQAARRSNRRVRGFQKRLSRNESSSSRLGLIGRDLAERAPRISARRLLPVLVASLVVALGLAALRLEVLRLRYALGDAALAEQRLVEEERDLIAQHRRLRDPVRLAREAQALGFVRPETLIVLPEPPAPPATATAFAAASFVDLGGRKQP